MEDEKIVELYWQRSSEAIAETSRKYGAYCMRISMNILANREDSEENVSDTYLRVWNSVPPQRPHFLAAFLGRIARNLALMFSAIFCEPRARTPGRCSFSGILNAVRSHRSPVTSDFPKARSNPC